MRLFVGLILFTSVVACDGRPGESASEITVELVGGYLEPTEPLPAVSEAAPSALCAAPGGSPTLMPAEVALLPHALVVANDGNTCTAEFSVLEGEAGNDAPESASAIRAKLLDVDGEGSGLDADTIDGVELNALAQRAHAHEGVYASDDHHHGLTTFAMPGHDHGNAYAMPGDGHDFLPVANMLDADAAVLTGSLAADGLHSHPRYVPVDHDHGEETYAASGHGHDATYSGADHDHIGLYAESALGAHMELVASNYPVSNSTMLGLSWIRLTTRELSASHHRLTIANLGPTSMGCYTSVDNGVVTEELIPTGGWAEMNFMSEATPGNYAVEVYCRAGASFLSFHGVQTPWPASIKGIARFNVE